MQELTITNRNGLKMALRVAESKNSHKLVFMMHGLGARKEYPHMLVLEEIFAQNGYTVVNIDATNSLNASESSAEGVTFTGFYQDLEDTIAWAETQPFYSEPFALAGQSLGAEAAVLYASTHPTKTNLIISAALPWINGKDQVAHNSKTPIILQNGYYDQVSKSTGRTLRIRKDYLDDMEQYDLTNVAKNITADTYLLVGLKDSEYHINSNKKLHELLKCKKELVLLPGVPHDLANTPETKQTFTNALKNIFNNLSFTNNNY